MLLGQVDVHINVIQVHLTRCLFPFCCCGTCTCTRTFFKNDIVRVLYNSNTSAKLCSQCPSGKKMLHKTTGTLTTCAECDAGQFQDVPGKETCKECPTGYYQNEIGIPYCVGCIPGQFQDQEGSESCIKCASGRKFNASINASITVGISASNCAACDKGQHQEEEGSTFCLPCLTGTFQNVTGSSLCNDCPIGFSNGETEKESCTSCPKGTFQDAIQEANCKGMLSFSWNDGSVLELVRN